jgi:hypothetical protein
MFLKCSRCSGNFDSPKTEVGHGDRGHEHAGWHWFDAVCGAWPSNPKRDANPALPGPCTPDAAGRGSTILQLCVDNVDATAARAVEAGAILRTEPQDAGWGDRVATIIDPFGHIWALATIQQELGTEEFNARGNIQLVEAA